MTTTQERPAETTEETGAALPDNVIGRLQLVQQAIDAVGKTGHYRDERRNISYDFRGVDAVVNAVGPALRDFGVLVTPYVVEPHYAVIPGENRAMRECTVLVTYRCYGTDRDDHIDFQVPGESLDTSDKGTAKAMSVAFRIGFLQTLSLPTDASDPDSERLERAAQSTRDDKAVARFVEDIDARIGKAATVEYIRGPVWDELVHVCGAGLIADAERDEIVARMKARVTELEAAVEAAEQETAAGLREAQLPAEDVAATEAQTDAAKDTGATDEGGW